MSGVILVWILANKSAIQRTTYLMEKLCSRGPFTYVKHSERLWAWNSMNCHFVGHSSFPFSHTKQLFRQHSIGYWMALHRLVIFRLLNRNCTHKLWGPWQSEAILLMHGSYTTDPGIKRKPNKPVSPETLPCLEAQEKEEKVSFPTGVHKLPPDKGQTSSVHYPF